MCYIVTLCLIGVAMFMKYIMVFLGMIFSVFVYANTIKLSPSESKLLTNHYAWTLNATCNIQGNPSHGKILIRIIEKEGTINGKHLMKGQATSMRVKSHQNIAVVAGPGTEVKLVNVGNATVEAICS